MVREEGQRYGFEDLRLNEYIKLITKYKNYSNARFVKFERGTLFFVQDNKVKTVDSENVVTLRVTREHYVIKER